MYSGGHKHILQYPIFRELLSLPLPQLFRDDLDLHVRNILGKLYIKLVKAWDRVGIKPTQISIFSTNVDLRSVIIETLQQLHLGDLGNPHGQFSEIDDMEVIRADSVANLNDKTRENVFNLLHYTKWIDRRK